jgi:hypothetical protein
MGKLIGLNVNALIITYWLISDQFIRDQRSEIGDWGLAQIPCSFTILLPLDDNPAAENGGLSSA